MKITKISLYVGDEDLWEDKESDFKIYESLGPINLQSSID